MISPFIHASENLSFSLPDFIDQIRAFSVQKYVRPSVLRNCAANGIHVPTINSEGKKFSPFFNEQAALWWTDYTFHLSRRLEGDKDFEHFITLFPHYIAEPGLKKYLKEEYDLSILPLNLAQGLEHAVKNHLPEPGYKSKPDPYAIKHQNAAIVTQKESGKFYVATRKPRYGTYLLTLTVPWSEDPTKGTFLCPIGCTHCYRGIETRNRRNIRITETNEELTSSRIQDQTRALLAKWDPAVYDVLTSGGEPLLFHNDIWKRDIIDVLKQSPYLKSFRICTGALALGLFARFDEQLIALLTNLCEETGIQVAINAHISHPENFTPEMVEKSLLLKQHNIRIMPQVPLIEGVNVWNHDVSRTLQTLRRLSRISTLLINEPVYKFIVDMQGSFSLLQAIRVYRSLFDRHQVESNIVRPISYELFVEGSSGNVNISYHTLFAIKMSVDHAHNAVTYTIPHPSGETVTWVEPLIEGINDDERLLQQAITESPIEE